MRKYIGVLLTIICFNSCMWGVKKNPDKHDVAKDTLAYKYLVIKQRAADCGDKPDSGCTVAKIIYPEFTGQKILNDTIIKRIMSVSGNIKTDNGILQMAKNFVDGYEVFKKQQPGTSVSYSLIDSVSVLRQDSSLITLKLTGYSFTGGAHGMSYTNFINWNSITNKHISLEDILIDGYRDKLTKIADTIFRKDEKLSITASLANNYFFKNATFALNNNFLITPLGLRFLYNEYEIKPYAAGTTDLFIPYAHIKSLVKPNAVVQQYLK